MKTRELTLEDLKAKKGEDGVGLALSLREGARYDLLTGARERLTGWGKICKARAKKRAVA